MIGYMRQTAEVERAEVMRIPSLGEEVREQTREMMPWRGPSESLALDNELDELYENTLRTHPSRARQTICSGCGTPITDATRVSDGMFVWHLGCARLGTNIRQVGAA